MFKTVPTTSRETAPQKKEEEEGEGEEEEEETRQERRKYGLQEDGDPTLREKGNEFPGQKLCWGRQTAGKIGVGEWKALERKTPHKKRTDGEPDVFGHVENGQ